MARIGWFVVPDLPDHVTQRGNRRERVFFSDADYELYRDLLDEACAREGVAVSSYCLRVSAKGCSPCLCHRNPSCALWAPRPSRSARSTAWSGGDSGAIVRGGSLRLAFTGSVL